MKKVELLYPTPLFTDHLKNYFNNYEKFVQYLIQCLNNEEWRLNEGLDQTKDSLLNEKSEYSDLVNILHEIIDSIKNEFEFDTERFLINQMWANKSKINDSHPGHHHPNSFFSGIVYLTDGSPTYFNDPVLFRVSSQLKVHSNFDKELFKFNPNPGQILIFPSWLYHGTEPNTNQERISISFNTFPEGKTNFKYPFNNLSQLNVYKKEKNNG